MRKKLVAAIRRLVGLHMVREDLLTVEERIASLERTIAELRTAILDTHIRVCHLQSLFGTSPRDDDELLTKSDLDAGNPWDRT